MNQNHAPGYILPTEAYPEMSQKTMEVMHTPMYLGAKFAELKKKKIKKN